MRPRLSTPGLLLHCREAVGADHRHQQATWHAVLLELFDCLQKGSRRVVFRGRLAGLSLQQAVATVSLTSPENWTVGVLSQSYAVLPTKPAQLALLCVLPSGT